MILIINLSTKFSTPQTLRRLDANAFTFSPRRTYVSGKTQRRFLVNVLAFWGESEF